MGRKIMEMIRMDSRELCDVSGTLSRPRASRASACEIILSSLLYEKKVFQEVQPMGGVGWRPSGRADTPWRRGRRGRRGRSMLGSR